MLLLITVAKFFNTNLSELHAVFTYLVIQLQLNKYASVSSISLGPLNLHFKFTLKKIGNGG